MKVYHGTSYENYLSIMEGNPITENNRNWTISQRGFIYFHGNDKNSLRYIEDAYSSAVICAAIHKSKYDKVVVIELDINKDQLLQDISDGIDLFKTTWCIKYDEFIEKIREAKIHYFMYYPNNRWMYLYNLYHCTCCLNWDYAKDYVIDVDEVTSQCDKWYEENGEYEWYFRDELGEMEEININEKVLVAGLNTIICNSNGSGKVVEFMKSIKNDSVDFINGLPDFRYSNNMFNYLCNSAIKSANEERILILIIEVKNDVNSFYAPYIRFLRENLGVLDVSHVVLKYDSVCDNFKVIKHGENKNLLDEIVHYSDLI